MTGNENKFIPNPAKTYELNIPKTATISYYTPEEVEILPLIQNGVYRSPKLDEINSGCGPMPNEVQYWGNRFYLSIAFGGSTIPGGHFSVPTWFREGPSDWKFSSPEPSHYDPDDIILESAERARTFLQMLDSGEVGVSSLFESNSSCKYKVQNILREALRKYNEGQRVSDFITLYDLR